MGEESAPRASCLNTVGNIPGAEQAAADRRLRTQTLTPGTKRTQSLSSPRTPPWASRKLLFDLGGRKEPM